MNTYIEQAELQISKCQLNAPISGTILTPQLKLKTGMTVGRGDMICEIADLESWKLVLEIPQEEIFWVQRRLKEGTAETVFFLEAFPEKKLTTEITSIDQISQIPQIHQELGNIYEIRVQVDQQELAEIQLALRDGITGRAKISTEERSLGFVLLRKVIRFFRITFF
ncbi:MAG: HlyD family secretion protein [Planctomycetes bacterium]|nr:HlyD family secretion protein [Planctomycetota bacterium]